jgi:hypothetical protein
MKFTQTYLSIAVISLCIIGSTSISAQELDPPDMVVLLHGLGRTSKSMNYMQGRLSEAGYQVFNYDYESRKSAIDSLVADLQQYLETCCSQKELDLHFVTHSLGGILVRALIAKERPENLDRVVMLSPPNKGSETVDLLKDYSLFKKIFGPASMQLGTDPESIPNSLGPADFELGIITGDKTIDPISSWIIPGVDDGKVAVKNTKLEGMADFLLVNVSHAYIMENPQVVLEVIHFLKNGKFSSTEELPKDSKK